LALNGFCADCAVKKMLTHSLTQETDKWISFVQTPVVLLSKNCSSWLVTVMLERNWWTLINTFSV